MLRRPVGDIDLPESFPVEFIRKVLMDHMNVGLPRIVAHRQEWAEDMGIEAE